MSHLYTSSSRRLGLLTALLLCALLAAAATAPRAGSAIKIYESSKAAPLLGKIKKGNCRVRGKGGGRYFRASAESTNDAYRLELTIPYWRGYRREYSFRYGTNDPGVFYLEGRGGIFSNIFAPPNATGLYAGGLGFADRGEKMAVGFLPASNRGFKRGVVLAGAMRC